eukprot:9503830-Pyramimonas_sp.AAC.1
MARANHTTRNLVQSTNAAVRQLAHAALGVDSFPGKSRHELCTPFRAVDDRRRASQRRSAPPCCAPPLAGVHSGVQLASTSVAPKPTVPTVPTVLTVQHRAVPGPYLWLLCPGSGLALAPLRRDLPLRSDPLLEPIDITLERPCLVALRLGLGFDLREDVADDVEVDEEQQVAEEQPGAKVPRGKSAAA